MTQARATMKAVRLHAYGGPEALVLEDAPVPEPGPGEVRVRVRAAGVNPFDFKVRSGAMKAFVPLDLPAVLGGDVAGVVDAVGPAVKAFAPGDEVYGVATLGRGSYAEFAVAPAGALARKPRSLDFLRAASVPVTATTAWEAIFTTAGLTAGQTLLIHGMSGSVGRFALQLARRAGARVLGTASASARAELLRLGAERVVDYRTERFEDAARDVEVVLDAVGGDLQARSYAVLKPGGILVALSAPPSEDAAKARGVRATMISSRARTEDLERIGAAIDEGTLELRPIEVHPLAEAARALSLLESGKAPDKLVLRISD